MMSGCTSSLGVDFKSSQKALGYFDNIHVIQAAWAFLSRSVITVTRRVHDWVRLLMTSHLQLSVWHPLVLGKLASREEGSQLVLDVPHPQPPWPVIKVYGT